ncbi:SYNE1 protein, partial [Polypterus senegalus]
MATEFGSSSLLGPVVTARGRPDNYGGLEEHFRHTRKCCRKRVQRKPPIVVNDLFEDIKDGVMLLALLEVLSGQKLPCEQGRQLKRIHWVSNIGTALKFLEGRRIEELTSNLPLLQSLSSSTSSVDSLASSETASPPMKRKVLTKFQGNAKKALLKWVQYTAAKRLGIEVKDFGPSWRSGVAFHAVIYAIRPDLVDMDKVRRRSNRENLEEAFSIAETELGIPRLLDPEDVDVDKPDEKSIMTYVAQFLKHYPDPHNTETDGHDEEFDLGPRDIERMFEREERRSLREMKAWLEQYERDLCRAQASEGSLQEKYQQFKGFRVQYEMKKKQIESLIQPVQKDGKLSVDQAVVKQALEKVYSVLLEWHIQLDNLLPGVLGTIGAWLHRAEISLREEISVQQAHEETANNIHRKLEQYKEVLKSLEGQRQVFQQIHKTGSVNGVPVPKEQLDDMAERFNFVSTTSQIHIIKLEYLELKYRLLAFLMVAESKLKSWIIKYGRRESVELLLQNYTAFIEGNKFFEQYEDTYQTMKQKADVYMKYDRSAEEIEGVSKFLCDTAAQWKNLSLEIRSVRSMLEEVISNWDKYSSTVANLQAWLEDAEKMLNQPENAKRYARADEVDKIRKELQDGVAALKEFVDKANEKMTSPLEVSFLNVRTFTQDAEDIKQKLPIMEAQFKNVTRNAQILTKDTPEEEITLVQSTMTGIKDQLSKLRERYLPLLRESQSLLSPLEEMEKQITIFYQSLEKASCITAGRDGEIQAPGDFKQKCQDLINCQEDCKKCMTVIDRCNQTVQRIVTSSKTLEHFDRSLLQKRMADLQSSLKVRTVFLMTMAVEATEWRKNIEANSSLMKRFEESRIELEKVLNIAQASLKEKGNPEELLKKHTEFFGHLDQRVLNAFLKACDEMTDILPENEQQSLQETVRKLHKQWKDLQTEAPYHLLHLKIEVEANRLKTSLEDCKLELSRENKLLPTVGSEQLIKEHKAFFGEKGPQNLCEKRLSLMEELCKKLPEKDPAYKNIELSRKALTDITAQIEKTYQKLMQHPDKWKEFNTRFSELSAWLSSKESQLRVLRNRANDPGKYGQVSTTIETEKKVSAVGQCVHLQEEVKGILEELVQGQKEAEAESVRILDSESVQEAQQLLIIHQQNLKRLRSRRRDVQQQATRNQQLCADEGVATSLQPDLQELESTLSKMEQKMETQEKELQVAVTDWHQFETDKEKMVQFLAKANSSLVKDLIFNSLESLNADLEESKNLLEVSEGQATYVDVLVKKSKEIKLGPKNTVLLQQQATSVQDQVNALEKHLHKDIKQMEKIKKEWEEFGQEYEDLSLWIAAKEKDLEPVNISTVPLDEQIGKVQDLTLSLEPLRTTITSLLAGARKVTDKDKAEQNVISLQQRYEKDMQQAKQKQTKLENLLAMWQRFEKEWSTFESWLERCEAVIGTQAHLMSIDQAKLQSDLDTLKDLQHEVTSHESAYQTLSNLAASLYPTARENIVNEIKRNMKHTEERLYTLANAIPDRIQQVQSHITKIQEYDDSLLQLSNWIEQFLNSLQSTCEVNITDLQPTYNEIKNNLAELEKQNAKKESLQAQVDILCSVCSPEDQDVLQSRKEDYFQLFREADQTLERRNEVLKQLEIFVQTHKRASGILHHLRKIVESANNWDKSKSESLQQELKDTVPQVSSLELLAVSVDGSLSKALYHIKEGDSEQRTSCRALADQLGTELELVQNILGTKQSEAEALTTLWASFKERKEQLLKSIEDIEEKADNEGLREPTLLALQQRLRVFNHLEDELNSHQHEMQWLIDKAKQLMQKGADLVSECKKEIVQVEKTWEATKSLIMENQEQCSVLIDLIREFQNRKSTINKIIESAENVAEIKSVLKDQEDIRRTLSRHEAIKNEMSAKQDELDAFNNKGKQVLNELKKIPTCDSTAVRKDMDAVVDQWLDVMDRIDENIERVSVCLSLWEDVLNITDEIDGWSNSSVSDLSENLSNLNNSQRMEERLVQFQLEIDNKEEKCKALNLKTTELKQLTKSQEPPTELQVLESDVRKKIIHARGVSDTARETLRQFSTQKQQLENFIAQMTEWLSSVEQSLLAFPHSIIPEDLQKVKDVQKNLQKQQGSIDMTRENLNGLCRKYHSNELEMLGGAITELIKKYEAVNQLSSKTLCALQDNLEQHFSDLVQMFNSWLSERKDMVLECSDCSGDMNIIEEKLQKLKDVLNSMEEGEKRLALVCEEGEKLLLFLPKPSAIHIQQQLCVSQQEWDNFIEECKENQQALEESASQLTGFDSQLKKLNYWNQQMEDQLNSDVLGERKPNISEKKSELEKVEKFHDQLLVKRIYYLLYRESFDQLCQQSQSLSDQGLGDGREMRATSQLQLSYQGLLKGAKERVRICQVAFQEHTVFEETLLSTWAWLKDVKGRLTVIDNTIGSKDLLEKRLIQVQEILLMKGEGEVKLNMAIGKGEQAMKSSSEEGQRAIRSKLQELKDVWASVIMASMSCHSCLDWTVTQWTSFLEEKNQLQQWMDSVEQELSVPFQQQLGMKEKISQMERYRAILSDVENHASVLSRLEDKASEMLDKTGDASFERNEQIELRSQFHDINTVVKNKLKNLEEIVEEHKMYHEAIREFVDWLHSAKEELQRWSDMSGDSTCMQRKLTKIRELIDSRQNGKERLNRVQQSALNVKKNTAPSGCELIDRETVALLSDWQQWENNTLQTQGSLESVLSQMASSEQEFITQANQLDCSLQQFSCSLKEWDQKLSQVSERNSNEEVLQGWRIAKDTFESLVKAETTSDSLKTQLNDLCRFSRDLSSHSERVSSLIKEYNSLCLRASKECQNKEKFLEQRFRLSFREFQQWLVSAKIATAKCFDVPQNIGEVTSSLLKIQEFLAERELGQCKMNAVVFNGEMICSILPTEKVETIQVKVTSAREDWKNLLSNLHQREAALQSQMKDFEASAEPFQLWLNNTETAIQESSARLHSLSAKRQEQGKLQSVLEEIACQEFQLNRLKEKAQQLWEGQAAGKGFVHRVSQLSAQYLALSNLTKEKASRIDRIVMEHQLFSQGLKELQDWVADANQMLQSYCSPTADKNVLDSRMLKLEALLAARQEKEIQLKMLLTRGESVQRNTSAEGVPVVRKQIQDLKDSWDSLLSACIQCKSQLEASLSQWTSYQDDVRQFVSWMDKVEENLNSSEKQYPEMRDKTTNLGKAKLLHEEVLSHKSLLETITVKGSGMAEHYVTQLEIQELQERYSTLKEKAKASVTKAEELVLAHQEYQRGLRMFEDWLEQEQEKLSCFSHTEGDVETLENTLRELQDLQIQCTEGQALLNIALANREKVIPRGIPQIEDRALETVEQEWDMYQARLAESRAHLNTTLTRLRQMEQKFQHLDEWLRNIETKATIRTGRRSDRATKEAQLQMLKGWHEETLMYKEEVEGASALAQQVLEETHINSRISNRATQLTSRYQAVLLHLMETIKQLEEEIRSIEEAQIAFSSYTDWLGEAQKNFKNVAVSIDVVNLIAMENKMKKLESLQSDMEVGHGFLKATREKAENAMTYLEQAEADELRQEVDAHLGQLDELMGGIRTESSMLEKCMHVSKEFLDRYKIQAQWLLETRTMLNPPMEPKAELYEKKAQLAKYKGIQQTVLSHESSVKSVIEKGEALLDTVRDATVSENMKKLQEEYQDLCNIVRNHVQNLVTRVAEHELYNSDLQDIEKWLLQMSSRLVASDSMQSNSLEMATQQLARHKAIMEEIASSEDRLIKLKDKGDYIIGSCADHLQGKIKQQIQAHQQGTRDSYSAICSTAQRIYQGLDKELQKHVSHQDTLQQCQVWLSTVRQELLLHTQAPFCLQDAWKQVKHYRALQEQASTYLDLVCSMCDLSDEDVRKTAADIQQIKQMVDERMARAQELAKGWQDIKQQKAELTSHFQDVEQQLQSLSRRPAELELKIAHNMLLQVQEFSQNLQSKQAIITQMTESVNRLANGQESSEHREISQLSNWWLELCNQVNKLLSQRECDLQRSRDYHDRISAVEALFDSVSKEWDNLIRTDAESTEEHLEALQKLAATLEDQRYTLEDLKDHKQKVIDRLNLDEKELVKEQTGHFEQRWMHLESLIEKKIQDSVTTLEEMSQVIARLKDAREWAEEQQPALSEAMKLSPPPELAQSFLFDHLSICSELESKQMLLATAVTDADKVMTHLGLNERQQLQKLMTQVQGEIDSLKEMVNQRRKYLSKAFSEKTQFLLATHQAINWIQQNERKAISDEHIALLPEDLTKQIKTCRSVQSSLKAYQGELTSLWSQGRGLMKDATEDEKEEVLSKLQELQNVYETALQRCTQRLQELEKVLVSRKYFKVDLDKTSQWLKQADIVTFPEINLMNGDPELQSQLSKYQHVLDQATEYENLLLIVQRTGQEILPSLNEVDHAYLDEKLNALPQQFNHVLALAKEKREKIQQVILDRKEYSSFIEVTRKALQELEEQSNNMSKTPVGLESTALLNLKDDYQALLNEISGLGSAISELNQKKETFRSTGQPWLPEEMVQLVSLYSGLKRQIEQKLSDLDDTLESFREYEFMIQQLKNKLKAIKEEMGKVNEETLPAEDKLKKYHTLAGNAQDASSVLKCIVEQLEHLSPHVDSESYQSSSRQIIAWQEELKVLHTKVAERMEESESRFVQSKDFQTEICRSLEWLQQIRNDQTSLQGFDIKIQSIQEEIRKQQILQEEVQSRLRIMAALSNKEKQKYTDAKELVPAVLEATLQELANLETEVRNILSTKQTKLQQVLDLFQKYHSATQSANNWLEEASALLQESSPGLDVELSEDLLHHLTEFTTSEAQFHDHLHVLESLISQLRPFLSEGVNDQVAQNVSSLQQKGEAVHRQIQSQEELLNRSLSQWHVYQTCRQQLIEHMNELEKKLTEFSTARVAISHEAELKLKSHKSLVSMVNALHGKITALEEQASKMEQIGNDASKATISRSMTTVWQRWTRLRNVARGQEKVLEDMAQEWRSFNDKAIEL